MENTPDNKNKQQTWRQAAGVDAGERIPATG